MKNSTVSNCAMFVLATLFLSVPGFLTANDEVRFPGTYPVAYSGEVSGQILMVDPDANVLPSFAYWSESLVENGTFSHVTFYQTVTVTDVNGNIVASITKTILVPPLTGISSWYSMGTTTQSLGLYTVTATMGYLDSNSLAHELDESSEEFSVVD